MKSNFAVSIMVVALAAGTAPAMAQIAQADVTGGRIAGTVAAGLAQFKGIAFAAPPVGNLRWKAPQPVTPWSGVNPGPAPIANQDRLKVLDAYYSWRCGS